MHEHYVWEMGVWITYKIASTRKSDFAGFNFFEDLNKMMAENRYDSKESVLVETEPFWDKSVRDRFILFLM